MPREIISLQAGQAGNQSMFLFLFTFSFEGVMLDALLLMLLMGMYRKTGSLTITLPRRKDAGIVTHVPGFRRSLRNDCFRADEDHSTFPYCFVAIKCA